MTRLFTIHDVDEETPVQYVGVYTMNWRPEWGAPTAMFAPIDDPVYDAAPELLEACRAVVKFAIDEVGCRWCHRAIDWGHEDGCPIPLAIAAIEKAEAVQ